MSRDGNGNYSLPAGNPVVSGTTITDTWANTTLNDIASALTQSIAKDGQTVPTANLPMGGYKFTNLGDGSANGQALVYGQSTSVSLGGGLTVAGALTANGNVIIGDAGTDTLTIAPSAVTWSNNPTHSGNHTFSGNLTYSGSLTGSTGVVNLGSGQVYKDGSGNVSFGTTSNPGSRHLLLSGRATEELVLKSSVASGGAGSSTLYFGNSSSDTVGFVNYDHASNFLSFGVGGSERGRIDSSGNVGYGVTPVSWGSIFKAMQLAGNGAAVSGRTDAQQLNASVNWYFDGSANKYIANGPATRYQQDTGAHTWSVAGSGSAGAALSFSTAFQISNAGNVYVGSTTNFDLTSFATQSKSTSGYQKLPGGVYIQWGTVSADGSVSFPTAFPNACWVIAFASSGSNLGVPRYSSKSTSGFVYSSANFANCPADYIAIGN